MTKHNSDADVDFVKALAELLRANDLTELKVERGGDSKDRLSVRVTRAAPQVVTQTMAAATAPVAPVAATPAAAAAPIAEPAVGDDPASLPGVVPSPMVGTVYLAPEPGTDNFVKVGDTVAEGQTLLIVEAMKTMNHIHAPAAGTVTRILVEDGAPVEYGAPLMVVA